MFIENLHLKNFRNYLDNKWSFDKQHNIILGANGTGKTNFLEALYFLSFGRSFRTNKDSHVVKKNTNGFYIKGKYRHNSNDIIEISYYNKEKKIKYNQKPILRKELFSHLKTVLLDSDDIFLVKGSAAYRRKYLDIILSQTDTQYLEAYIKYNSLLKQKNIVLKKKILI